MVQYLESVLVERCPDLLVVLDKLRADDDTIAEGGVAHLLAGEERDLAQPPIPRGPLPEVDVTRLGDAFNGGGSGQAGAR